MPGEETFGCFCSSSLFCWSSCWAVAAWAGVAATTASARITATAPAAWACSSSSSSSCSCSSATTATTERDRLSLSLRHGRHRSSRRRPLLQNLCRPYLLHAFATNLHQAMGEESRHGGFLRRQVANSLGQLLSRPLLQRAEQAPIQIAVEDRWVDIAFPTNGRRIAQQLRQRFHSPQHALLRRQPLRRRSQFLQRQRRQISRGPGTKILCRDPFA